MGQIKKLDPSTILKLAAGEIIDRPVAIVKELIENSIDAGANIIKVSMLQGGISEIKIQDNGMGISNDDIQSTIEPHATSKLSEFDDLMDVITMGFRGEALASISEVSHVTILSFNGSDELGAELVKVPGKPAMIHPKAREMGTTITVSHLFKNIPVRFRFLKSPTTEGGLITRLIQQFSLHYPMIQFELIHNENLVITTPGNSQLKDQFTQALKIDDLLAFQKETNGIKVSGVMSAPNQTFKQRSKCWFSVNGRMVKSAVFFKAVDQALVDIIPKHTFPAIVCNIECETQDVDINIHPKKEDVKFSQPDDIFIAIKRAIQSCVMQPATPWQDVISKLNEGPSSVDQPFHNHARPHQGEFLMAKEALQPTTQSCALSTVGSSQNESIRYGSTTAPHDDMTQLPNMTPFKPLSDVKWVAFKNKFIFVPLTDHVLIFDQHAVHERILYDKFCQEKEAQSIVSIPLLVPEYISLPLTEMPLIDALVPMIRSLGIDFERFDEESYILREIPQFFSTVNITDWITTMITSETIAEVSEAPSNERLAALQMKACKAAVKAGQKLHDLEVRQLIQSCIDSPTQFTCPHGRPLYIKMMESQLDSLFLRS